MVDIARLFGEYAIFMPKALTKHCFSGILNVMAARKVKNEKAREYNLKRAYGIDLYDYNVLLEKQNGICAICHKTPQKRHLDVDHDHKTGLIRGLLCGWCNRSLMYLRNDANNALEAFYYLNKANDENAKTRRR